MVRGLVGSQTSFLYTDGGSGQGTTKEKEAVHSKLVGGKIIKQENKGAHLGTLSEATAR